MSAASGRGFAREVVEPLAAQLVARRALLGRPIAVGLGGGQGAGKSTLAAQLVQELEGVHRLHAVSVSLDDFYLTRQERLQLASTVHPELQTRGPGTHDVALAERTMRELVHAAPGAAVRVPRFDKAADDRVPDAEWRVVDGPLDVVLLEGVLVGVPPEPDAVLVSPINDFERQHDPDGRLRRHAQAQHAQLARALDPLLEMRVFLAVPDLERVLAWRGEQERGLGLDAQSKPRGMDAAAIDRFVARFERLTQHALRAAPPSSDVTLELDAAHQVAAMRVTPRAAPSVAR